MKIGIATDHNGVKEKQEIIGYLEKKGYDIIDYSQSNNPIDDYPEFAFKIGEAISRDDITIGILMCGTGIGMSIAANKINGVRCAKVSNIEEAKLSREHNNANVIAISFKLPIEEQKAIIEKFITTNFSNEERHIRRINMIKEKENER